MTVVIQFLAATVLGLCAVAAAAASAAPTSEPVTADQPSWTLFAVACGLMFVAIAVAGV